MNEFERLIGHPIYYHGSYYYILDFKDPKTVCDDKYVTFITDKHNLELVYKDFISDQLVVDYLLQNPNIFRIGDRIELNSEYIDIYYN